MTRNSVIEELIQKSLAELNAPPKPVQKSRTWSAPEGYRYLVQWSNLVLLRYLIRLYTSSLPKAEYKRKAQLDDAARSSVRNIEEGYKRSNTATYLEFIGFSQGSLEEVKGDVRDLTEDMFLPSKPGSSLKGIGIDLGELNRVLKPKPLEEVKGTVKEDRGFYVTTKLGGKKDPESDRIFLYRPVTFLYPPLKTITAQDLTFEIFIELINKTDFLLRKLVESLEIKLNQDKKFYKVGQARIKDAIKNR